MLSSSLHAIGLFRALAAPIGSTSNMASARYDRACATRSASSFTTPNRLPRLRHFGVADGHPQQHHLHIQANQLVESLQQRLDAKELRPAVEPRIMMDADFHHAIWTHLELPDEFHADGADGREEP